MIFGARVEVRSRVLLLMIRIKNNKKSNIMISMIKKSNLYLLVVVSFFFFGCEKNNIPPELPPAESMIINFDDFASGNKKSATLENHLSTTNNNKSYWETSSNSINFWNFMIGVTLAVPVASYYAALAHQPNQMADGSWEWKYTFETFGADYHGRLRGKINNDIVHWKMYISKTGIDPFNEVLWFEGESKMDGSGGKWILNKDPHNLVSYLQVDWSFKNGKVVKSKYTYIEEGQISRGSFIEYGVQPGIYDRYYSIYYIPIFKLEFEEMEIEWNSTTKEGHIQSRENFHDLQWRCWDSDGYNTICE